MKKTLLAAALLTGYAGLASAQNSVTLYGVLDMGLAYQSIKPGAALPNTDTKSNFGTASGTQAGSRWGVRGVEDLSNGLKANFVYEVGFDAADGVQLGNARQSTLGLSSDSWGALDMGRRQAPSSLSFSGIDPFALGFGTASLGSTMGNVSGGYRLSNLIMYTSPTISGFRAMAGYSFNTGLATDPAAPTGVAAFGSGYKSRAISLGARYANGPILLAANFDNIQAPSVRTGVAKPANFKIWNLGGTYDLKVVKIHAAYGQSVDGVFNNTQSVRSVGAGGDDNIGSGLVFRQGARTQSWMVGASAPVGTGSVFASVQQKLPGGNLKELPTSNELVASVGYTYPFSNRTNLYAAYSYANNVGMVTNAVSNQLFLGVRHQF